MKTIAATAATTALPVDFVPSEPATRPGSRTSTRLALAAMGLLAATAWLLLHPYAGINHDATLYTLFALARLHPDNLGNDVFLRFGSQDHYTLFTPIYAAAIATFGLDGTALVLTLLSQAALLACAWLLARRFTTRLEATLAIALLLLIPSEYGAGRNIFHYFEPFLSPRLPAEALTLGAVVAALARRHWTASVCLVTAMLLHPLMGVVGVMFVVLTFVAPIRPKLVLLVATVGLIVTLLIAQTTGWFSRPDAAWLAAVRDTSEYLFLPLWKHSDWSRTLVPLSVLGAGWIAGTHPLLRQVCAGSLAMVACGLAATLVFGDMLHLSLFIGAQPWRCLWLANVIAVSLAPVILLDCWRRGSGGRTGVILLASALVFRSSDPVFYLVPAALACVAAPADWDRHRFWRPVFFGVCALLALDVGFDLSDRLSYVPVVDATLPALPQKVAAVCGDGVLPEVLVIVAWLALRRWRSSIAVTATIASLAACACAALSAFPPGAWQTWTQARHNQGAQDKFAPWRAQIPPRAEVWWPESPVETWSLLNRPSYWSLQQMAGDIFSREKALVVGRRMASLVKAAEDSNMVVHDSLAVGGGAAARWGEVKSLGRLNLVGLKIACSDPELGFIVSWQSLAPTLYPPVVIDPSKQHGQLYLYNCADLRSRAHT